MKMIESFQLGLFRTAFTICETKYWPARISCGGCSSFDWLPWPPVRMGSTSDTAGSVPAAAWAEKALTGGGWEDRNGGRMPDVGRSEKKWTQLTPFGSGGWKMVPVIGLERPVGGRFGWDVVGREAL